MKKAQQYKTKVSKIKDDKLKKAINKDIEIKSKSKTVNKWTFLNV